RQNAGARFMGGMAFSDRVWLFYGNHSHPFDLERSDTRWMLLDRVSLHSNIILPASGSSKSILPEYSASVFLPSNSVHKLFARIALKIKSHLIQSGGDPACSSARFPLSSSFHKSSCFLKND